MSRNKNGFGWVALPDGSQVMSEVVLDATGCLQCLRTTTADGKPRQFYSYSDEHRPFCNLSCFVRYCDAARKMHYGMEMRLRATFAEHHVVISDAEVVYILGLTNEIISDADELLKRLDWEQSRGLQLIGLG